MRTEHSLTGTDILWPLHIRHFTCQLSLSRGRAAPRVRRSEYRCLASSRSRRPKRARGGLSRAAAGHWGRATVDGFAGRSTTIGSCTGSYALLQMQAFTVTRAGRVGREAALAEVAAVAAEACAPPVRCVQRAGCSCRCCCSSSSCCCGGGCGCGCGCNVPLLVTALCASSRCPS